MNIYLLEFIILAFNVVISHSLNEKQKKAVFIISCVQLFLLGALRDPYDMNWQDTLTYITHFKWNEDKDLFTLIFRRSGGDWEPGIDIVAKLISFVSKDYQAYIIGLELLIMLPRFWIMYRYCSRPVLALFIYYAMGQLSTTSAYRAALAMSCTFIAYKYAGERKAFRFFLWIVIGFLFHQSALVFAAAYFIYYLKPTPALVTSAIVASGILFFFSGRIIQFLSAFMRNEYGEESRGGYVLMAILWVILIVGFIYCRDQFSNPDFRFQYMLVAVSAVLQPMTFSVAIFSRLIRFFLFYMYLLMPRIVDRFENASAINRRFAILIEFGFIGLMFVFFLTTGNIRDYAPFWAAG